VSLGKHGQKSLDTSAKYLTEVKQSTTQIQDRGQQYPTVVKKEVTNQSKAPTGTTQCVNRTAVFKTSEKMLLIDLALM